MFEVHFSIKSLTDLVPEISNATKLENECQKKLFCGIPFYLGLYHGNREHSVWIPAGPPKFLKRANFRLVSQSKVEQNVQRYTFEIQGPSRMSLHVSPLLGAKIIRWSLLTPENEIPPAKITWHGRAIYFINFTKGKYDLNSKPNQFNLDIETLPLWNRSYTMDIGFVAHYIDYTYTHTDEFKNLVNSFPKWTNVQNWTSLYESYQF